MCLPARSGFSMSVARSVVTRSSTTKYATVKTTASIKAFVSKFRMFSEGIMCGHYASTPKHHTEITSSHSPCPTSIPTCGGVHIVNDLAVATKPCAIRCLFGFTLPAPTLSFPGPSPTGLYPFFPDQSSHIPPMAVQVYPLRIDL